jgi:hypothetical protein
VEVRANPVSTWLGLHTADSGDIKARLNRTSGPAGGLPCVSAQNADLSGTCALGKIFSERNAVKTDLFPPEDVSRSAEDKALRNVAVPRSATRSG